MTIRGVPPTPPTYEKIKFLPKNNFQNFFRKYFGEGAPPVCTKVTSCGRFWNCRGCPQSEVTSCGRIWNCSGHPPLDLTSGGKIWNNRGCPPCEQTDLKHNLPYSKIRVITRMHFCECVSLVARLLDRLPTIKSVGNYRACRVLKGSGPTLIVGCCTFISIIY